MAVRDPEYYDYALDPEAWPEFMRAGLIPAPPSGQADMWPDASAAPVYAPDAGMPVGLMWPTMPRPPQQAPDQALFMQSGMLPTPPAPFSTPFSWGTSASAEDNPPVDEAAAALDARRGWARRMGEWDRRGTQEYVSPGPPPVPPMPYTESANYWGAGPTSAVGAPYLGAPYLAAVPPAPDWRGVRIAPTASEAEIFAAPSGPQSWLSPAPVDGATAAQEARDAAAMTTGRRGWRGPYEGYTAPPPAPAQDENHPDLAERRRLNFLDSYYRGSLFGAARLALLAAQLDKLPDDDSTNPATRRLRQELLKEYQQIVDDLSRYDRMPRFQNWSELGSAAVGRLGAGALSPESWIGLGAVKSGAQGGRAFWGAPEAALKNGILFGATDPVVQGLNIQAGVQDEYDPLRTFAASGLGVLFGGGAQLGTEGLRKLAARWLLPTQFFKPRGLRDFTPEETAGMKELFDQAGKGARSLLDKLERGEPVSVPSTVTRDTLETYPKTVQWVIDAGKDRDGAHATRVRTIRLLLGRQ